jgi:hypothetical protein
MSKRAITTLFIGSIVAAFAGIVLAVAAVAMAFGGGAFQMDGPDVVGLNGSAFTWTMIAMMIIGGLTLLGAAIAGLVAWIGALLNTTRIDDKTWFVMLLVLGIFSFGFIAMIAYVIAGPDGTIEPVDTHDRALHVGGAPA